MNIPTCGTCGETFSIATGLPVFVSFRDGVATIGTDLSELDDFDDDQVRCRCADPKPTDDELMQLRKLAERVNEIAAPSLDVTL